MPSSPNRLASIFGSSRSGTTWLGAIAASNEYIAYRFEPFHRLGTQDERLAQAKSQSNFDPEVLYRALLPSDPTVDKPPFFKKHHNRLPPSVQGMLWAASRFSHQPSLFKKLQAAPYGTPIIFKEVEYTRLFLSLLDEATVPAVYMLRHPCAVVWSRMRGVSTGLMPDRLEYLTTILSRASDALRAQFEPQLTELEPVELEALLWRLDVEAALEKAQHSPRALIVLYESLCSSPLSVAETMFKHFDLPLTPTTERFIETSTSGPTLKARINHGEWAVKKYFSVFRDPSNSAWKWMRDMPQEFQRNVLRTVSDSPAYRFGVESGVWA